MLPHGPRRILLAIDSLSVGGAERHVVDVAAALAARGDRPMVACSAGGPLEAELAHRGVPFRVLADRTVKRRFCQRYATGLRRLIAAEGIDLVHAHLYASATSAAAALRGTSVPLVITEQTEAPWRGPEERLSSARAHHRAAQSIAVSTPIAQSLRLCERVPRERVTVIPNTVLDGEGEQHEPRRRGEPPVVGVVARLQPEKALDVFLRAAALVAEQRPDVRFRIVGDGPLREELGELARSLGVAGRVSFLGGCPDGRERLRGFDVFAMSSAAEGTPLTIVEAMRAGVPIAATAAGGIPDQIRDGVDGLLVPCGDHDGLGRAVLRLLEEPAEAARLAGSARRRALTEFSFDRMVDRILEVYRRAEAGGTAGEDPAVSRPSAGVAEAG